MYFPPSASVRCFSCLSISLYFSAPRHVLKGRYTEIFARAYATALSIYPGSQMYLKVREHLCPRRLSRRSDQRKSCSLCRSVYSYFTKTTVGFDIPVIWFAVHGLAGTMRWCKARIVNNLVEHSQNLSILLNSLVPCKCTIEALQLTSITKQHQGRKPILPLLLQPGFFSLLQHKAVLCQGNCWLSTRGHNLAYQRSVTSGLCIWLQSLSLARLASSLYWQRVEGSDWTPWWWNEEWCSCVLSWDAHSNQSVMPLLQFVRVDGISSKR